MRSEKNDGGLNIRPSIRKPFFTLLEIIFVFVLVVGVITFGIPIYKTVVERAKAKVCYTNLQVLQAAIDHYGMENHVLPSSLSQLRTDDMHKAWAEIFQKEPSWVVKLAYFIIDSEQEGMAFAQENFVGRYLRGDAAALRCPSDPTPPPNGVSYGMNKYLVNIPYEVYAKLKLENKKFVVIADCEHHSFAAMKDVSARHRRVRLFGGYEPYALTSLIFGSKDSYILPFEESKGFIIPEYLQEELSGLQSMAFQESIMIPWQKKGEQSVHQQLETITQMENPATLEYIPQNQLTGQQGVRHTQDLLQDHEQSASSTTEQAESSTGEEMQLRRQMDTVPAPFDNDQNLR